MSLVLFREGSSRCIRSFYSFGDPARKAGANVSENSIRLQAQYRKAKSSLKPGYCFWVVLESRTPLTGSHELYH